MIFTHGSNVNFQESACEMTPKDLDVLLKNYLTYSESLLVGTIHLNKQELYQYGIVQTAEIDPDSNQFHCSFTPIQLSDVQHLSHSMNELVISHEARFDVLVNEQEKTQYQVAFVTFNNEKAKEITYFFADQQKVENPLEYIIAFWELVSEVGRDVDFSLTGCSAHDFAKKIK